ncbi:hypothetical protein A2572_02215 [Candidatus Collierbacteria bacterium RIFOXYD1_FULL_40_9]|uniref:Undecaprenyl-phosphate alpha-N-acetylglucosaminyl 1-phosphate transferase n=1 Tax=Candidatus Collierbacteria bacterium RIFOXYD1_FULL_40_9 TaxID=1817731 RepID=A0A1F5FTQ6_9BACT|nr:MAG: hypothetical protein A2572_02215 [Candidatus Collierbacteria bacterium RIFOXYD1_FULL_40_9]
MDSIFSITALPFFVSLLTVVLFTPLTVVFFKKEGWLVDPRKTPHPAHTHKEPIPKGGGLPVFLGFLAGVLTVSNIDNHLIAIISACLVTLIVGLIDDVKSINPYFRLVINFLSALIIVLSGIGISFITNPLGGIIDLSWPRLSIELFGNREIWILADLFAILWIPALMNAINWSSGVDGQISGVITIAAFFLGVVSLTYSADITQWPISILAFSLAGAFAGFTVFHFYPQKIMPGYSGTSLAGLILGVLSILATGKVGTAILLLAVPLIDFIYVIFRRVIIGKSPVWGGNEHLHHKLMEIGWGKRRIAVFYWTITALLGGMALNFEARYKFVAMIGLVLLMVVFWIWQYFGRYSRQ